MATNRKKSRSLTGINLLLFLFLLLPLFSGCLTPKFEDFSPYAAGEYGDRILGNTKSGEWLWVRGRITADLDRTADSSAKFREEEVLLITKHKGSRDNPGIILTATIYIIRKSPESGRRTLICKKSIYSLAKPKVGLSVPHNTLAKWPKVAMRQGTLKLTDVDEDGKPEIVATLYSPISSGVAAIHQLLRFKEKKLFIVFAGKALQPIPEIKAVDINKDGVEELVVPVNIFTEASNVQGKTKRHRPLWPAIYTPDSEGYYKQSNSFFPAYYQDTLLNLYEDFAFELEKYPARKLTIHSLYFGLIYNYMHKQKFADMFLQRSAAGKSKASIKARRVLQQMQTKTITRTQSARIINNNKTSGPEL